MVGIFAQKQSVFLGKQFVRNYNRQNLGFVWKAGGCLRNVVWKGQRAGTLPFDFLSPVFSDLVFSILFVVCYKSRKNETDGFFLRSIKNCMLLFLIL